jgi:hypothetical protein
MAKSQATKGQQLRDDWVVYDSFADRKRGFSSKRTNVGFQPHILQWEIPQQHRCGSVFVRGEGGNIMPLQAFYEWKLEIQRQAVPCSAAVDVENLRYEAMKDLRAAFDEKMEKHQFVRPREAFNRWIFEKLTEETTMKSGFDPLLPTTLTVSPGLVRELVDDAKHFDAATRDEKCVGLCNELCQESRDIAQRLKKQIEGRLAERAEKEPQATWLEKDGIVTVLCGSRSHQFLEGHFRKLQKLFAAYNSDSKDKAHLADRLFAVLQRYRGATGYRPNEGSGHHCATPPEVLNALRDNIGVEMECFASPFNSHFFHFCTAFGDTDVFFGSMGSFFTFFPVEGSFEVGPPFVEELMEEMRLHIEALIAASDRPLSFAIIIPEWTDPITPCIAKIYQNATGTLKRKIVVPKEAHVYHDGFQHTLRDTLFKPVHNTLVLVMQNEAGSRKWPVTDDVEKRILATWAACAEGVRDNPLLAMKRTREEIPK